MTIEELAKQAFEAYNTHAGGKTWDDRPIPTWDEVGDKVRGHWHAAIEKVIDSVQFVLNEPIPIAMKDDK